jgi:hypothetical protein
MRVNSLSNMKKLFATQVSNFHLGIILPDYPKWHQLLGQLNNRPLAKEWSRLEFVFHTDSKRKRKAPDISTVYISGSIAFRAELKDRIFPSPCGEFEFLPILVSGEEWLILNCLKTTRQVDEKQSEVIRIGDGPIFMIQKLVVNDLSLEQCEVFTVEDSNRAELIVLPSFKERIETLKLQGLTFREIGYLTDDESNREMSLKPDENILDGSLIDTAGPIKQEDACMRIVWLVEHVLEKVAAHPQRGDWECLYRDPADGRYWERTHPHEEMRGGGAPRLAVIPKDEAITKYKI